MSAFLIHQEESYLVALTDSLATKEHPLGGSTVPLSASKLVEVAPGTFAVHAGTWQPSMEMLTRLREVLINDKEPSWGALCELLPTIGRAVYEKYKQSFGLDKFDIRVAVILTGDYRHPADKEEERSTSIVLWEAAREFEPVHVRGHLYFASSSPLSEFATTMLTQPFLGGMLRQGPLACAQALVATHAALARLATTISLDANVIALGDTGEHTLLHGAMITLPQSVLVGS
jgi:hypothetical protein